MNAKTTLIASVLGVGLLMASSSRAEGTIRGLVLDQFGRVVPGARVLVATSAPVWWRDGKFDYGSFQGDSTTTDEAGRFSLRGESRGPQKVVVISPDRQMVWPALQSEPGEEMNVTLPKPGAVLVRYDIPGDAREAKPEMFLWTTNKEASLWSNVCFSQSITVSNGGQTVLTNLTPGTYNFRRWKPDGPGAETEQQIIEVKANQTLEVDMVRTNGQRIRGQVVGLDQAKATGGSILVRSGEATGQHWPQRSRNEQKEFWLPNFDVLPFGADGAFETVALKPGTYTIVANVYPPEIHAAGANTAKIPYRNHNPDYIGVAKVTVTTNPIPPVTIRLAPARFVDIAGQVVDDETGLAVPDVIIKVGKLNPDKPGEIIWTEGFMGISDKFVIDDQKEGSALCFQANGYVPQTIIRDEVIASRKSADLTVRMKRGDELNGVVLDHTGHPVPLAKVYLAPVELGYVIFGEVMSWEDQTGSGTNWAHTFTTTDAAGRFSLRGVWGNKPRLIVVSEDGQMVQPVPSFGPGQILKITLPEPATLVVRFDIPGDAPDTYFDLSLHTNTLEPPLWKYVTLKMTPRVSNGGQIVLSNLTPGIYDFSRTRMEEFGDPAETVSSDHQSLVLESGRTQKVLLVRSEGQRVQGRVTGFVPSTNSPSAYVCACPTSTIGNPFDFKSPLRHCSDAVELSQDGSFRTARLEPGDYTLVAEAFKWGEPPASEPVADDQPQYAGFGYLNPMRLALVASANVTITTNRAPPLVKLELHPWVEPRK